MTAQQWGVPQVPDDSYPAHWFPQLSGGSIQREEILRQLEELPDDVLAQVLNAANRLSEGGAA